VGNFDDFDEKFQEFPDVGGSSESFWKIHQFQDEIRHF
jgi:hypothetical protein